MIISRTPWVRQPQVWVCAKQDGFLRNAGWIWNGGTPNWDLVSGNKWSNNGCGQTLSNYGRLIGDGTVDNGSYLSLSANAKNSDVSGAFCLVWIGMRWDTNNNYDCLLTNRCASNGNNIVELDLWGAAGADNNKPYFNIYDNGGTNYYTTIQSQSALPLQALSVVVGVWNGANLKLYQDGTLVATTAAATTMTSRSEGWRIGARYDGGSNNSGQAQAVLFAAYLRGERSALEVAEFSKTSTSYLRHLDFHRRKIWTPQAAGGLPTLSASTYVTGSLTSTGWRPQVTAT